MKFEVGKFYSHDTSEYEYTDNTIVYLYCRSIANKNANYPNAKPFYEAELISISGEGISKEVSEDGTPTNGEKWYTEICSEVFATKLLEESLCGNAHFNEEIRRRNKVDQETKENEFESPFHF